MMFAICALIALVGIVNSEECTKVTVQTTSQSKCLIELQSYGHDDMTKTGYIMLNGDLVGTMTLHKPKARGVGIVALKRNRGGMCSLASSFEVFDTHGSADEGVRCANFIKNYPAGTIFAIITGDESLREIKNHLAPVQAELAKDGIEIHTNGPQKNLGVRYSWAAIMTKGTKRRSIYEIQPRYSKGAEVVTEY